ncbi:hypothetical protein [Methanolobus sp. WCC5]|uniref:hypothetical protein n=1 Tax=Methanolobus sp. WCC5 TaxID=3125785 RepID=UPI003246C417
MKVKLKHELLVVAIALIAIIAMAAAASAEDDVNTLRLYGENGYSAAFPYTDPVAPFDPMNPEAPQKDFVTFNPALMEDWIVVNNIDSKQKVFARQWFVPEYTEPTGMVWLDEFRRCYEVVSDNETIEMEETLDESELREMSLDIYQKPVKKVKWIPNHNEYTWEDVVTEYTYMFVDKHYQPREATAKSPTGAYWTNFWFPVADRDDAQIGLDSFDINDDGKDDMVTLRRVGDFNRDGHKDISISSELFAVNIGDRLQFLDHIVEIEGIYYVGGKLDSVAVKIFYNGNTNPEQIGGIHVIEVDEGILSSGRHTVTDDYPQFYEPWYLKVEGAAAGMDKVLVRVGRQIYERETFFVDGAEYDVARIYGSEKYNVKYITIRNPVPEHQDVSLNDLSVVKKMVDNGEYIPMLPPFNMVHTMIDDINIMHTLGAEGTTCYYGDLLNKNAPDGEWYESMYIDSYYDTIEERKIYDVDPLLIYFIDKTEEPRFHTNLLEILDENEIEAWKWLHIRTMPDFYKEFVYPELPDADDRYGDFLFTSSWRAPNSDVCETPRDVVLPQRVMFVYDQVEGFTDLYINEIDETTNGLRIYGENGYSAAFPYTDPEGPFDPMSEDAPIKDFVTINPAKIKAGIVVDNRDSWQKVFFRQWFVPEYVEPTGRVWIDKPNKYVWEDVVNEFTYMFIDKHYQPTEGTAMSPTGAYWTYFYFPVADRLDQTGLDSFDINGDGNDNIVYLMDVGDFEDEMYTSGDGLKDIFIASELFSINIGDRLQFLDHIVEIEDIYYKNGQPDSVAVKVYYNGNTNPEQIGGLHVLGVGDEVLSSGRHTVTEDADPQFYEPWCMRTEGVNPNNGKALVRVGRLLHTGETFFVDGAEYDVAAIFGSAEDNVKYITIRNPIPEHQDVALNDLSVVKKMVDNYEIIPVLPPFNREYVMIDDIDVPHSVPDETTTCYYGQILAAGVGTPGFDDLLWYQDMYIDSSWDTIAERMFTVPALEIYFTGKDIEERFHTNLLEILCEGMIQPSSNSVSPVQSWVWLHIRTMPDFYKEFVYPDVPNAGGTGDYLLTSSFLAPNSVVCEEPDVMQRLMFTHNPLDGTGLYMNGGVPAGNNNEPPVEEMKGDYNGDEVVNFFDFVEFAACYNSVMGDSNYNAIFDFNDDGVIDFFDFVEFAGVYQS